MSPFPGTRGFMPWPQPGPTNTGHVGTIGTNGLWDAQGGSPDRVFDATDDGSTIDQWEFDHTGAGDHILIHGASNMTFSNCIFGNTVTLDDAANIIFDNCDFSVDSTTPSGDQNCISLDRFGGLPSTGIEAHRCNMELVGPMDHQNDCVHSLYGEAGIWLDQCEIHEAGGDAIHLSNGTGTPNTDAVRVTRCWIHHIGRNTGAHGDGVQIRSWSNITLLGNFFDMEDGTYPGYVPNSPIISGPFGAGAAAFDGLNVQYNWFGGGLHVININLPDVSPYQTGVVFGRNRWGREFQFFPFATNATQTWTGWSNVWDDTGVLLFDEVPPPGGTDPNNATGPP